MELEPLKPSDYTKAFPKMDREEDHYYVYLSIIGSFNLGYYIPSGVIEILSKIDCRLEFDIYAMRDT